MTDATLVDTLGALAGVVWMSASLYFQLIRTDRIHPAFVSALFLIGVALMMGSSALALGARPGAVELLGIAANSLFIVVGITVWWALEHYSVEFASPV